MSERVVNGQNSDRQDRTQGSNESSMQAASRQHRRQIDYDTQRPTASVIQYYMYSIPLIMQKPKSEEKRSNEESRGRED